MVDDCSVKMYCEDGYELYIFDSDKGANGYKELKGVCALKTGCACPYIELDSSNIDVYLGENESYKNHIKGYAIQKPEVTQYKEDGCPHRRECPEGWQTITVWNPLEQDFVDISANRTRTSDCTSSLGENESYKNYIKGYAIQAPEVTQYKEDGCQHRRQCP
ncbi:hypothetical protein L5515_002479 [Caenorhabditis briggsae]|uniref:Uncharacterized protein n=1 Tax=Caenorhabditis briggsae TaxID=6238 RepID=A0AAE9J4C0_CAEBR|nr:hypothetical protein L5515_002479 [Caenorhabditis briggsae]